MNWELYDRKSRQVKYTVLKDSNIQFDQKVVTITWQVEIKLEKQEEEEQAAIVSSVHHGDECDKILTTEWVKLLAR